MLPLPLSRRLVTPNSKKPKMSTNVCHKADRKSQEQRRRANYKSSTWSYDFIQSLQSAFTGPIYRARAEQLKEEFTHLFCDASNASKLQMVDNITKLGLSSVFNSEIKDFIHYFISNSNNLTCKDEVSSTALTFRVLGQLGYNVSQDLLLNIIDKAGSLKEGVGSELRGALDLFEASHLAKDGEAIMVEDKALFGHHLVDNREDKDINLAKQVTRALESPYNWRVTWFDVRNHIHAYELQNDSNSVLLELAKLNFNICQALHLQDLQDVSRWWKNLGLIENINFTRDRLVESFLWAVGVGCEPEHALLRKCLTKTLTLVLVIDDMYDIYGSLEELECFTSAIQGWDYEQVQELPDCMKICLQMLQKTVNEIANDIGVENGLDDVSCYLRSAWADFCKAMLVEAGWYYKGNIPSLEHYLRSAWISSSGPLMSIIVLLCTENHKSEKQNVQWTQIQDLVYYTSLIIRLCNDLGTSAVEVERGDAPSSIICYMVEANVTEDIAREHIKEMILDAWNHVNIELQVREFSAEERCTVNLVINMARVCHFMYQNGDGFSEPGQDTRKQIKRLLIQPLDYASGGAQ